MREMIFLPSLALVFWIIIMILRLAYLRVKAVRGRDVRVAQFKLFEGIPEKLQQASNNVNNLFQLPLLFFLSGVFLFLMDKVSFFYLFLSWGFVFLRIIHSLVHITSNDVRLRFYSFAMGLLFLLVIYGGLFWELTGHTL
jgi:hypothetical protein